MIILKHFIAEHFRLLRRIDLHFPQRGSILIQGPNEAGKSTLFEGIYFALYGEALSVDANKRGNPHLDELISYGERAATVTLTVTIGATELTVTRIIERGRGQRASLAVRRLGMPEDNTITNVASVNQRIVRELGQINSETLRNSFLIEQKSLGRLERLTGTEREETLRRLLGLEKFTRLAEQFKLTDEDEKALHESVEHLRLAELQARIPEVSAQLGETEAALDAVAVTEALAAIDQQEAEIGEQQGALEQLEIQRNEIKGRQSRIKQLKKANETLGQIIAAYDSIAEAQREIPDLERQITELERREREELPSLEQRVRELSELAKSFGTLEHMAADLLTVVNTIKELEQEVREHEQEHPERHRMVRAQVLDVAEADRPDADQDQARHRQRDEDRVDRRAAFLHPVHVAQVQDQRELVEDEGRAHAEDARRRGVPDRVRVRDGQGRHAADEHEYDAEHHVVDVQVADLHVLEPPADLRPDQADVDAYRHERDDERHEEAEQRQPAGLDDPMREKLPHVSPPSSYALIMTHSGRRRRLTQGERPGQ